MIRDRKIDHNSHRLKVCMLSSVHQAHDTRIVYKEGSSLAQAGYTVSFIVPHQREEHIAGVHIIPLGEPRSRMERLIKTTLQAASQARKVDADVYHFHDPELIPVGLWLKWLGKRVIYDVHEDAPRQIMNKAWIPMFARKRVASFVERLENWAASRLNVIITATDFIEDRFRANGAVTATVCNYPKREEFYAVHTDQAQTSEMADICYVGSISNLRGLREMVTAMSMSKRSGKLRLAGEFVSSSEREEAELLPGWERVEYLGQLNRDQLNELIHSCRIGLAVIHPTVNYVDALPIKLFEYMAVGIPVIGSSRLKWRDIVEQEHCGLCVDPYSPEELAAQIDWLIEHPAEAAAMGENGKRAVETIYNWDSQREKLIQVYEDLDAQVDRQDCVSPLTVPYAEHSGKETVK